MKQIYTIICSEVKQETPLSASYWGMHKKADERRLASVEVFVLPAESTTEAEESAKILLKAKHPTTQWSVQVQAGNPKIESLIAEIDEAIAGRHMWDADAIKAMSFKTGAPSPDWTLLDILADTLMFDVYYPPREEVINCIAAVRPDLKEYIQP